MVKVQSLVISLPTIICIYYENIFTAYSFLLHFRKIQAQQSYADSLKNVSLYAKEDITKTIALYRLSWYYSLLYPDSALYYADKLIQLSTEENFLPRQSAGVYMQRRSA